jgi:hypothetical protein
LLLATNDVIPGGGVIPLLRGEALYIEETHVAVEKKDVPAHVTVVLVAVLAENVIVELRYGVTDAVMLKLLFGAVLFSVTDAVMLKLLFGGALFSVTDAVMLKLLFGVVLFIARETL